MKDYLIALFILFLVCLQAFEYIGYDVKGSGIDLFILILMGIFYQYQEGKLTRQDLKTGLILALLMLSIWVAGIVGIKVIYGVYAVIFGLLVYYRLTQKPPPPNP